MEDTSQPRRPPGTRSKRIIKWGSGLVAAFLAFAPPGTMILIAVLAWQFLGDRWVVVAALVAIVALGLVVLVLRLRR